MSELDRAIREALKAAETEDSELLGSDPPLHQQIVESFRGRLRWLNIAGVVVALVLFVIACACAWRFVRAPELREMLIWGASASLAFAGLALIKIWFWMALHRHTIQREVKRLELQIACLAARLPEKST